MVVSLIVCCVIYGIFIGVTMYFAERAGNVFTTLGIIISDVMALYCFGSITTDEWVFPLIAGLIHLLFGMGFCYLVGIVTRRMMIFREQKGYRVSCKNKKKFFVVLFAILLGWCGGHKFYLGKKSQGAVYAMYFYTCIPLLIGWIEAVRYIMMSTDEFEDRYNNYLNNQVVKNLEKKEKKEAKSEPIFGFGKKCNNIKVENLHIKIGTASIEGDQKDKLKICIINTDGKIYEFNASGSIIESFKAAGNPEMRYDEV